MVDHRVERDNRFVWQAVQCAASRAVCSQLIKTVARVTERTKAIIVVHMHGHMCPDMEEIVAFARAKKLLLIEDTSQAPQFRGLLQQPTTQFATFFEI